MSLLFRENRIKAAEAAAKSTKKDHRFISLAEACAREDALCLQQGWNTHSINNYPKRFPLLYCYKCGRNNGDWECNCTLTFEEIQTLSQQYLSGGYPYAMGSSDVNLQHHSSHLGMDDPLECVEEPQVVVPTSSNQENQEPHVVVSPTPQKEESHDPDWYPAYLEMQKHFMATAEQEQKEDDEVSELEEDEHVHEPTKLGVYYWDSDSDSDWEVTPLPIEPQ